MKKRKMLLLMLAEFCAGAINGLFGAGGGMVLVPMMTALSLVAEDEVFPFSVAVMLPVCLVSLMIQGMNGNISMGKAVPYMLGAGIGGILAGKTGRKIPVKWLHRGLGAFILWGGIRYLC